MAKRVAPLRDQCLAEAMVIVAHDGVANLSLREVARRLSVSHQAPYKHFVSRDHLLAEAIGRAYEILANTLREVPISDIPATDLGGIGRAYLRFARENPALYRMMFDLPLPELTGFEGVEAKATVPFSIVMAVVARLTQVDNEVFNRECALFAWATVHGLASMTAAQVLPVTGFFEDEDQVAGVNQALSMICEAISARAVRLTAEVVQR